MKYKVLFPVWHTNDLKYYQRDEEVELDHLDGEVIQQLISSGIIDPVTRAGRRVNKKTTSPEKGDSDA